MRLLETQKADDNFFMIKEGIQQSAENILKMLDHVQIVKQLISDPVNQQLHFIKHSKK